MANNLGEIQLIIPCQSAYLDLIRQFVVQLAKKIGFPEEDMEQIELAVDEACTNVIKYAYQPENVTNPLDIHLRIDDQKLTIIIRDYGIGFNPDAIESPEMKAYLSEYRTGGLGIYLMRTLMDEVHYEIQPGKKTEVIMTKYLPGFINNEELKKAA